MFELWVWVPCIPVDGIVGMVGIGGIVPDGNPPVAVVPDGNAVVEGIHVPLTIAIPAGQPVEEAAVAVQTPVELMNILAGQPVPAVAAVPVLGIHINIAVSKNMFTGHAIVDVHTVVAAETLHAVSHFLLFVSKNIPLGHYIIFPAESIVGIMHTLVVKSIIIG
jgi:hypothetical protein